MEACPSARRDVQGSESGVLDDPASQVDGKLFTLDQTQSSSFAGPTPAACCFSDLDHFAAPGTTAWQQLQQLHPSGGFSFPWPPSDPLPNQHLFADEARCNPYCATINAVCTTMSRSDQQHSGPEWSLSDLDHQSDVPVALQGGETSAHQFLSTLSLDDSTEMAPRFHVDADSLVAKQSHSALGAVAPDGSTVDGFELPPVSGMTPMATNSPSTVGAATTQIQLPPLQAPDALPMLDHTTIAQQPAAPDSRQHFSGPSTSASSALFTAPRQRKGSASSIASVASQMVSVATPGLPSSSGRAPATSPEAYALAASWRASSGQVQMLLVPQSSPLRVPDTSNPQRQSALATPPYSNTTSFKASSGSVQMIFLPKNVSSADVASGLARQGTDAYAPTFQGEAGDGWLNLGSVPAEDKHREGSPSTSWSSHRNHRRASSRHGQSAPTSERRAASKASRDHAKASFSKSQETCFFSGATPSAPSSSCSVSTSLPVRHHRESYARRQTELDRKKRKVSDVAVSGDDPAHSSVLDKPGTQNSIKDAPARWSWGGTSGSLGTPARPKDGEEPPPGSGRARAQSLASSSSPYGAATHQFPTYDSRNVLGSVSGRPLVDGVDHAQESTTADGDDEFTAVFRHHNGTGAQMPGHGDVRSKW